MNTKSTAQQTPSEEQVTEKHYAIQAVIDAHIQFENLFGDSAPAVWSDLLKADYEGSTLNKILYLNK